MSHQHVEIQRAMVEAWNGHDLDAVIAFFDEDVVYADRRLFGLGRLRGREALREHLASILDANDDLRNEAEVLAARDDVLVVLIRVTARSRISGGEVELVFTRVFTFRNNRIVGYEVFDTPEEALEAVGPVARLRQ
jgi:ketosteroid isomerase-like protein